MEIKAEKGNPIIDHLKTPQWGRRDQKILVTDDSQVSYYENISLTKKDESGSVVSETASIARLLSCGHASEPSTKILVTNDKRLYCDVHATKCGFCGCNFPLHEIEMVYSVNEIGQNVETHACKECASKQWWERIRIRILKWLTSPFIIWY